MYSKPINNIIQLSFTFYKYKKRKRALRCKYHLLYKHVSPFIYCTLQENFYPPIFWEIESAHEKTENQIKSLPLAATNPWEEYFWRIFIVQTFFLNYIFAGFPAMYTTCRFLRERIHTVRLISLSLLRTNKRILLMLAALIFRFYHAIRTLKSKKLNQ